MSEYYNAQRTKNLYNPASNEPFRLNLSKFDQLIYNYYALTLEEIKIIEEPVK